MNNQTNSDESPNSFWALWAVVAAFGTYFCMYGFRKPFTSAEYLNSSYWEIGFKTIAVSTQVIGYTISKFIGIKVISEMKAQRRALAVLILIGIAHLSLAFFGLFPRPWNAGFLFFNGLALGMVFGLVLGFLEGRQLTEALVAGLCTSFILADGVTKSVGTWLLDSGVSEQWMPFTAGLVYLGPLLIFVFMLTHIPPPTEADKQQRNERQTMTGQQRWQLFLRYWQPLTLLVVVYILITVIRSIRADFAPELWRLLGATAKAETFSSAEMLVALGVLLVNGIAFLIVNNRTAFFASMATCCLGFVVIIGVLVAHQTSGVAAYPFMVLIGFGLYLPYVAMHTTVFERILAVTREHGNLGYLMYLADAFGYLGYVVVMIASNFYPDEEVFLNLFILLAWVTAIFSLICLGMITYYFSQVKSE